MSDVLLAQKWSDEDPTGWWVSEKLDGVRALWRRGEFVSRGDNAFVCPDWFKRAMPADCVLDGELWGGRRQFQKTVGIVKSAARAKEWEFLTFMVFDALQDGEAIVEGRPFEERLAVVRKLTERSHVLKAVPMEKCGGREHLQELLGDVERRGGEGLMLRKPGSLYEHRRSHSLLKVKSFHDEEARVTGHEGGKGRVASMCGALQCETPDGRKFKVGSGLSDAQRRDPPKIGSVITYRYQELTVANIPRFPTLVAERVDMEWRQVCAEYVPPGPRLESALKKKHTVLFGDSGGASGGASGSTSGAAAASSAGAGAGAAAAASSEPRAALRRALTALDARQAGVAAEDLDDLFEFQEPGAGADAPVEPAAPAPKRARTIACRPVCEYGTKCYRKNPAHFAEFAHPWLDEENDDVLPGLPGASGAAAPSASSSAGAGSAGPPAPETVPAALDPPVVTPASPETLGTPAPPASEPLASRTAADAPDVRIVALRNLMKSLLEDATREVERAHFVQLLDLLDRGPFGGAAAAAPGAATSSAEGVRAAASSALSSAPPERGPASATPPVGRGSASTSGATALVDGGPPDARPPAPALERTGTPSILEVDSGSPPDAPAAAPGRAAPADDGFSSTLRAMGFSDADVAEARSRSGAVDAAVEWLLSREGAG